MRKEALLTWISHHGKDYIKSSWKVVLSIIRGSSRIVKKRVLLSIQLTSHFVVLSLGARNRHFIKFNILLNIESSNLARALGEPAVWFYLTLSYILHTGATLYFYSVQRQTILLVKVRAPETIGIRVTTSSWIIEGYSWSCCIITLFFDSV